MCYPGDSIRSLGAAWDSIRGAVKGETAAITFDNIMGLCEPMEGDVGSCAQCGHNCLEGWVACPSCGCEDW